jgi:hypothetical protein
MADRGAQRRPAVRHRCVGGALIALARKRVPAADLRVGDMESLPYQDDSFDLVTG